MILCYMAFELFCVSVTLCSLYNILAVNPEESNEERWCLHSGQHNFIYPYNFPYFMTLEEMTIR